LTETVVDCPIDLASSKQVVGGLRTVLTMSNLPNEIDIDRVHSILAESNSRLRRSFRWGEPRSSRMRGVQESAPETVRGSKRYGG